MNNLQNLQPTSPSDRILGPGRAVIDQRLVEPSPIAPRSTEEILRAICRDARTEALKYALRSDTGHDGE